MFKAFLLKFLFNGVWLVKNTSLFFEFIIIVSVAKQAAFASEGNCFLIPCSSNSNKRSSSEKSLKANRYDDS